MVEMTELQYSAFDIRYSLFFKVGNFDTIFAESENHSITLHFTSTIKNHQSLISNHFIIPLSLKRSLALFLGASSLDASVGVSLVFGAGSSFDSKVSFTSSVKS